MSCNYAALFVYKVTGAKAGFFKNSHIIKDKKYFYFIFTPLE